MQEQPQTEQPLDLDDIERAAKVFTDNAKWYGHLHNHGFGQQVLKLIAALRTSREQRQKDALDALASEGQWMERTVGLEAENERLLATLSQVEAERDRLQLAVDLTPDYLGRTKLTYAQEVIDLRKSLASEKDRIERLEARVGELEGALRPFAKAAEVVDDWRLPDEQVLQIDLSKATPPWSHAKTGIIATVKDVRTAQAVLESSNVR